MKKTALAILAVLTVLVPGLLPAQPAPADSGTFFSFLGAADRQALFGKGALTEVGTSFSGLKLGPGSPFEKEMKSGLSVKDPTVASLGYFLFPKPTGNAALALYNAVSSVASMEGLQYYSVTDKKRQPLILASWRVASAEDPRRIPDPVFTQIPPVQKAVIFQKDNRFGEGLSLVTWKTLPGDSFQMTMENLKPMSFAFFRIVDPSELRMVFVVVPLADKVAVCAGLEGRTAGIPGLEKSLNDSIRNRMKALAEWLGTRIAALDS